MREPEATVAVPAAVQTAARSAIASRRAPGTGSAAPRRALRAALVTLRPRQWIKNVLVIAAAGAAGALGHDDVPVRVGLAFVAFCLLASGIYAINDVRDAEEDRLHPRKCLRPIAAGELVPRSAVVLGIVLMLNGIVLCAEIRPVLVAVGVGYLALTLSYTLVWRRLLVLDIVAVAGGFVLRAVAGGVAAPVTLSRAFVVVVTGAAVFAAAGKRQAELRRTDSLAASIASGSGMLSARRRVLEGYTPMRLRVILVVSAVVTLAAYAYWAFELPSVRGIAWRPMSLLPVAAALGRYGVLIANGQGEAPEDLLLRDRPLQLAGLAWLALFALGVHAAG
ncbi:MAG TPA: decaprenyl-phosphate phosphoribosyltransferase [Solirubrobacteraceae bacterium]|nr:decaprenyl-phosphate phosphoribosyltransferase [Solirubrobacteraceae bacterium]